MLECACAQTLCGNSPSQPLVRVPGVACAGCVPALPALALPSFSICHEWGWLCASSVHIQASLCFGTALYLYNYLFTASPLLSELLKGKGESVLFTAVFFRHLADNTCLELKNYTHLPISYSLYMHQLLSLYPKVSSFTVGLLYFYYQVYGFFF